MPAIAKIDSVVTVTPLDSVQIILGSADQTYREVDDRNPFAMRVCGVMEEKGETIGVYGPVVSGHERYRGLIATLLMRLNNSDWKRDNQSHAQFKVGPSPARLNGKHPFYNPMGTDIEGFPIFMRFGSVDSRVGDEQVIDSATEAFRKSQ